MARFGFVATTMEMETATFKTVAPVVFGSVMTVAMLVFITVVFLVKRRP